MTPEQLKASILQYAIQGKLVEQRPEEGTAEELYQQIQEEKKRLIAEGKIKKEKPLPEITDDEIPFGIPDSWKWVRMAEIIDVRDGTHDSPKYVHEGIPLVTSKNLSNGEINYSNIKCISQEDANKINARSWVDDGDILFAMIGSIGNPVIVKKDREFCIKNMALFKGFSDFSISNRYFYWFLFYSQYSLKREATGGVQSFISLKRFKEYLIPLPPIAEQHRIVSKIEQLLPLIDRYASSYEKLERFNARFPEDMKKSILQYAIQGKLVEQRPEEGTAEELYKKIQEEKKRLIAEGKIKKEKPLPEITDEEIPFDIPESWKWARIGELFAHNTGKAMNSSAKQTGKSGSKRKFITTSNVYWNRLDFANVKEMFFSDDELERCTATKGDLLVCEGGAYYGRTAIWNYEYDVCFQNHIHRLRRFYGIDIMFYYYIFFFYRNTNLLKSKGTAMPGLSSIVLHQMVVPLPPVEEQHRIVAKIEELLPYCERLKEAL